MQLRPTTSTFERLLEERTMNLVQPCCKEYAWAWQQDIDFAAHTISRDLSVPNAVSGVLNLCRIWCLT